MSDPPTTFTSRLPAEDHRVTRCPVQTLLLYDDTFLAHDPPADQAESPWRFSTLRRTLLPALPLGVRLSAPTRPATLEELQAVHEPGYLARLLALRGRGGVLDEELLSPGSVDAALLAAGAAVGLVEELLAGRAHNGMALLRPPGHHAGPDKAMGWCLLGNAAIAAAAALRRGVRRVLLVDWDAHHGNGTQRAFWESAEVLFVDLHQDALYPEESGGEVECGAGAGLGMTVNLPLPAGSGDADASFALERVLLPLAARFRPELVLVSCGFDAHRDDVNAELELTPAGYAALCRTVQRVADEHAGGRLALLLEGGYDPAALAAGVRTCLDVLSGEQPAGAGPPPGFPHGQPSPAVAALVGRALGRLGLG